MRKIWYGFTSTSRDIQFRACGVSWFSEGPGCPRLSATPCFPRYPAKRGHREGVLNPFPPPTIPTSPAPGNFGQRQAPPQQPQSPQPPHRDPSDTQRTPAPANAPRGFSARDTPAQTPAFQPPTARQHQHPFSTQTPPIRTPAGRASQAAPVPVVDSNGVSGAHRSRARAHTPTARPSTPASTAGRPALSTSTPSSGQPQRASAVPAGGHSPSPQTFARPGPPNLERRPATTARQPPMPAPAPTKRGRAHPQDDSPPSRPRGAPHQDPAEARTFQFQRPQAASPPQDPPADASLPRQGPGVRGRQEPAFASTGHERSGRAALPPRPAHSARPIHPNSTPPTAAFRSRKRALHEGLGLSPVRRHGIPDLRNYRAQNPSRHFPVSEFVPARDRPPHDPNRIYDVHTSPCE